MTLPRLLILSFSDISTDARVLKQVRHFAGIYDVTTCGYGPTPDPRVEHIRLDDAHGFRRWRRRDLALRRFRRIYWEQPAVVAAMTQLAPLGPFDAILANDIDTVGSALALAPTKGVHADIHEFAPRQNDELRMWRWFDAPYVTWMCRQYLPGVTSMTTVGQGLAAEYRQVFGVDADVVTNATPYADLHESPVANPLRLVHSGASLRNRHLETLVDAVEATRTDVELDLYLMGNDPGYVHELRERTKGSARVTIRDPLPYSELVKRLNEYDLGVHVIPPTNFNNRWSLPNKFFDYVQARLGLIIGPSPEMRRLLDEHHLGAVCANFSPEALTAVLDALTVEDVALWKSNASVAARELSSESQVQIWDRAVGLIVAREPS